MAEHPRRPLGELLVERGALDQYELDHWLKEQRLSGMLLGELLVRHRVVSPMEVAAALAVQRGADNVAGGIVNPGSGQLGARPNARYAKQVRAKNSSRAWINVAYRFDGVAPSVTQPCLASVQPVISTAR